MILIQEVGAKDERLTLEMSTLETHNLKNNGGNLRIVPAENEYGILTQGKEAVTEKPSPIQFNAHTVLQPPQNNRPLSCQTTTTRSFLASSKDVEKKLSINNRWSKSYPNIFFSVFQRRRKKFQIGGESVIVNLGYVS